MKKKQGYLSLCYHYIRPEKKADLFPRMLGNRIEQFREHLRMLKKYYDIISPDDARRFSCTDFIFDSNKYGMLFTFDDGLSDHYQASEILAENGIQAIFFIPTCILADKLPINSVIIPYCLAKYGIGEFLKVYKRALDEYGLNLPEYIVDFRKGIDNPWQTIGQIKSIAKYKLGYKEAKNVFLYIYKNLFLKDYPNALEIMHLTEYQIQEMLKMGHSLGVHSHSHISIASTATTEREMTVEITEPRHYMEKKFQCHIDAFSYPFGAKRDCFDANKFITKTDEYKLAFTVENIINTKQTSPLELGRYMPHSLDDSGALYKILETIVKNNEHGVSGPDDHSAERRWIKTA